jgi:hypothetical protein
VTPPGFPWFLLAQFVLLKDFSAAGLITQDTLTKVGYNIAKLLGMLTYVLSGLLLNSKLLVTELMQLFQKIQNMT